MHHSRPLLHTPPTDGRTAVLFPCLQHAHEQSTIPLLSSDFSMIPPPPFPPRARTMCGRSVYREGGRHHVQKMCSGFTPEMGEGKGEEGTSSPVDLIFCVRSFGKPNCRLRNRPLRRHLRSCRRRASDASLASLGRDVAFFGFITMTNVRRRAPL